MFENSLLRLSDVLAVVPVSRATWYAGVKLGLFPQPIRLGLRRVAWRAKDIARVVAGGKHHG